MPAAKFSAGLTAADLPVRGPPPGYRNLGQDWLCRSRGIPATFNEATSVRGGLCVRPCVWTQCRSYRARLPRRRPGRLL
jgi:hypothetical protein